MLLNKVVLALPGALEGVYIGRPEDILVKANRGLRECAAANVPTDLTAKFFFSDNVAIRFTIPVTRDLLRKAHPRFIEREFLRKLLTNREAEKLIKYARTVGYDEVQLKFLQNDLNAEVIK